MPLYGGQTPVDVEDGGELGADLADFDGIHLAAGERFDAQSPSDRRRRRPRRTRRRRAAMGSVLAATNSSSSLCEICEMSVKPSISAEPLMLCASRMRFGNRVDRARRLFEAQQRRAERLEAIARLFDEFARRRPRCRVVSSRRQSRRIQQQEHFVVRERRRRGTRACASVRAAAPASASGPPSDTARHRSRAAHAATHCACRAPSAATAHRIRRPLKYSSRSKCGREGSVRFRSVSENASRPLSPDARLRTRQSPSGSRRPRRRAAARPWPATVIPSSPGRDRAAPSVPPPRAPCR